MLLAFWPIWLVLSVSTWIASLVGMIDYRVAILCSGVLTFSGLVQLKQPVWLRYWIALLTGNWFTLLLEKGHFKRGDVITPHSNTNIKYIVLKKMKTSGPGNGSKRVYFYRVQKIKDYTSEQENYQAPGQW